MEILLWKEILVHIVRLVLKLANEFNESEFSVKESIENAIENEVQDNYGSPLFDCGFSVKGVED